MELNQEQMAAIEQIKNGGNFFITGKAGAGKTTIIQALKEELPDVIFCAPTGAAARLIGGQTLHSMFQLPKGPAIDRSLLGALGRMKKKILKRTKTVVIDEISMVRGDILQAVDYRLRQCYRKAKDAELPFGGRNMVFVGDFYQLPPVIAGQSEGSISLEDYHEKVGFYAFQTMAWKSANIKPIYLKKIMRQCDKEYIKILNTIRSNDELKIRDALETLNTRVTEQIPEQAISLCSTKWIAAAINTRNFRQIDSEPKTFTAEITGQFNPNDYPNEVELKLKVGERVIITVNSKNYCNGDVGTITGFSETGVVVKFDSGTTAEIGTAETPQYSCKIDRDENGADCIAIYQSGSFRQIPLIPGYAITIHRSQGMTFPQVVIDLGDAGCFASGQLYVALSRCRSLDSLYLKQKITEDDVFIDHEILEEDCFWKIDYALMHKVLSDITASMDDARLDLISLDKNYTLDFLNEFLDQYLTAFDAGETELETVPYDYGTFLEEELYIAACNLHLERTTDIAQAMRTFKQLIPFL